MGWQIRFTRGTTAQVAAETPAVGEPLWDSETNKLYVGDGSTAGGLLVGLPIASDIKINSISGATYDDLQDWINLIQSAGLMTGGGFTANANGTLKVAAGTGFVKAADSETGATVIFDWAEDASVSLTDNAVNTIYIDYNGGSPTVNATTTPANITHTTQFTIGTVYREGTTLSTLEGGTRIYNLGRRVHRAIRETLGITRVSGLVTAATGTRQFTITAGVVRAGLNRFTISEFNSSSTNFRYWYNDGAWQSSNTGTISNTQYNNYGTGLADVTANRYGVHWVFMRHDGSVDVVYGVAIYKLAEAMDACVPANLPDLVASFSTVVAKIIIEKDAAAFAAIETPFEEAFTKSQVADHNDLGNLQGGTADEYYHITAAQNTLVAGITASAAELNLLDLSGLTIGHVLRASGAAAAAFAALLWADIDKTTSDIADITTKSHTSLSDIGSNAHSVIDTHLGSASNPHTVTATQVGKATAQWNADKLQGRAVQDHAPVDTEVLTWVNANSQWEPAAAGGGITAVQALSYAIIAAN